MIRPKDSMTLLRAIELANILARRYNDHEQASALIELILTIADPSPFANTNRYHFAMETLTHALHFTREGIAALAALDELADELLIEITPDDQQADLQPSELRAATTTRAASDDDKHHDDEKSSEQENNGEPIN